MNIKHRMRGKREEERVGERYGEINVHEIVYLQLYTCTCILKTYMHTRVCRER